MTTGIAQYASPVELVADMLRERLIGRPAPSYWADYWRLNAQHFPKVDFAAHGWSFDPPGRKRLFVWENGYTFGTLTHLPGRHYELPCVVIDNVVRPGEYSRGFNVNRQAGVEIKVYESGLTNSDDEGAYAIAANPQLRDTMLAVYDVLYHRLVDPKPHITAKGQVIRTMQCESGPVIVGPEPGSLYWYLTSNWSVYLTEGTR